jgi:D-methionine transport system ATP-binding protein
MLTLKNVSIQFAGRQQVVEAVRNVSLRIAAGEIFGIVGSSGAGKSTLLRAINLLERPGSGEIWLGDREITGLQGRALRELRQRVAMVFQHFELVGSRTVYDNVALPLRAAGVEEKVIARRVPELLELVELSDKVRAYPGQLSGGQKQRVGIARALANNPEVLLCDEPTSALDLETTEAILRLLADINKRLGVMVVIISHEMAVIKKICHRVAVMKNGVVVEDGDVYNVFSAPRHPFTQELVAKALDLELPERVRLNAPGVVTRLLYLGDKAEEPVLAEAVHQHGVVVNILHGRIEYIADRPIGILIVSLVGPAVRVQSALESLQDRVAKLEVLQNG